MFFGPDVSYSECMTRHFLTVVSCSHWIVFISSFLLLFVLYIELLPASGIRIHKLYKDWKIMCEEDDFPPTICRTIECDIV